MPETVKLYDINERDYPNKRGDTFRCLQVFECGICGGLSNHVEMGGWPGLGVRVHCPNDLECWHHELQEKLRLASEPHPQSYLDELVKELDALRGRVRGQIVNDILGTPDLAQRRRTNCWRSANCAHGSRLFH